MPRAAGAAGPAGGVAAQRGQGRRAARSTPAASAVATRICARSAAMAASSATSPRPRSPRMRVPGQAGPRSGWHPAVDARPQGVEPGGVAPDAFRRPSSISSGPRVRSGRPVASVTSSASRWDAIPAATTGSTETRPLGQQGDEGLVLDLGPAAQREVRSVAPVPQRRPGGGQQLAVPGVPAEDLHQRAPAWPSAVAIAAPRSGSPGGSGGLDAQVGQGVGDLGNGEAAVGEPNSRWTMAADPIPTAEAAIIPMGRVVPSAIPATDPSPPPIAPRSGRAGPCTGKPDDHRGGQRQTHAGRWAAWPDAATALAVRPVGSGEPSGEQRVRRPPAHPQAAPRTAGVCAGARGARRR